MKSAKQLERPSLRFRSFVASRPLVLTSNMARMARQRALPWLVIIVLMGLGLRSYHYLSDPPVWHDEAAQIYNVQHKAFGELLEPLYYSEACPPLFLAMEKCVVLLLGDSTFALRLVPYLASCAALIWLVVLARPILSRSSLLCFAFLLSVSDRLLWHASEAKPYAVDVLVATAVFALGLRLHRASAAGGLQRWLLVCAVLSPLMIWLSFPACFLLGGLVLTLLPGVWRSRRPAAWLCLGLFVAVLCSAFVLLYITAIQAQRNDRMLSCWVDKLPNWEAPWFVPIVGVIRLTELARYTLEPVGNVFCVFAAIGLVSLWRARQRYLLGLLLFPLALNGVAWLHSSYPLEASRVVVYTAPAVLLLFAVGMAQAWAWAVRRGMVAQCLLSLLLVAPLGQAVWVFIHPWGRLDSKAPVEFVLNNREPGEPVVGTLWEQAYYCRRLGPLYRALIVLPTEPTWLPPAAALDDGNTPAGQCVTSLWLLSSSHPEAQSKHINQLWPGGPWEIVESHSFHEVTVLRLRLPMRIE
jgi:hypothetical protein